MDRIVKEGEVKQQDKKLNKRVLSMYDFPSWSFDKVRKKMLREKDERQ